MTTLELRHQIATLTIQNQALRRQLGQMTPEERGHQLRRMVDQIVSMLDAAGCYYASQYRVEMATAICDVLYGNAPVDLPTWGPR